MSPRSRNSTSQIEDLADAPFIDEEERAESEWLVARENDPDARPPSSTIAAEYTELEGLLANLPVGRQDDAWHDEVLRRASSLSRSRPWWRRAAFAWGAGTGFIAAAAIVILLLITPAPELQVSIRHSGATRDLNEAVVGDRLVVSARAADPADLRVYRSDGILVARCPNGPGCTATAPGTYAIDVRLDAPIQYRAFLVVGITTAPPNGTMDTYMDAARAANARIVMYQPIDVH